tara:strand:- start:1217 stop:1714 length:498 start_codon:yes stop_codon:yes gene_type:complete
MLWYIILAVVIILIIVMYIFLSKPSQLPESNSTSSLDGYMTTKTYYDSLDIQGDNIITLDKIFEGVHIDRITIDTKGELKHDIIGRETNLYTLTKEQIKRVYELIDQIYKESPYCCEDHHGVPRTYLFLHKYQIRYALVGSCITYTMTSSYELLKLIYSIIGISC